VAATIKQKEGINYYHF